MRDGTSITEAFRLAALSDRLAPTGHQSVVFVNVCRVPGVWHSDLLEVWVLAT
jgi:hypothetical protein